MFKTSRYILHSSFLLISFFSFSDTTYYKCVTEKGTVFSQLPCDDEATTYKVNTTGNQYSGPKTNLSVKGFYLAYRQSFAVIIIN